jgi:uncharacterized protein (TIGR03084 family)
MSDEYSKVLADLAAESDYLDAVVAAPEVSFGTETPAVNWTIGHQIGHLIWTDRVAALACSDPELFAEQRESFLASPAMTAEAAAQSEASRPKDELLGDWRSGRDALQSELGARKSDERVAWLGPPMSVTSLAVSRIMETWAHGVDITDTLGQPPGQSPRLRWVADLGVRTRNFAYRNRGLAAPDEHFRVELSSGHGEVWAWGPEEAADRISGSALDYCLLVTQRRHLDDLGLTITGSKAQDWASIAQVYAGPPGPGRAATHSV